MSWHLTERSLESVCFLAEYLFAPGQSLPAQFPAPGPVEAPHAVLVAFDDWLNPYQDKLSRLREEMRARKEQEKGEEMNSKLSYNLLQLGYLSVQFNGFLEQCKVYGMRAVDSPEGRSFVIEPWHRERLEDWMDEVDQVWESWRSNLLPFLPF